MSPLKLSPRTRSPRTSCLPGQFVLGPRVPLGQLVLTPCVPLRMSCPPISQRLKSSYIHYPLWLFCPTELKLQLADSLVPSLHAPADSSLVSRLHFLAGARNAVWSQD